jgi:hypothetical protein
MAIAAKSLKEFVATAKAGGLEYNHFGKERWHRLARRVAKALAERMDLQKNQYSIRYLRGGPAVSGDTILHSERLYVNFSVCHCGRDHFMYRSCKGQQDYTGGTNRWMKWDELLDLDRAAAKLFDAFVLA